MNAILFNLFQEHELLAQSICSHLKCQRGEWTLHTFPDDESLVTIHTPIKNKPILILATFDRPNIKIMNVILFIETLRELGANHVTLIAPYLAYMRQDKIFHDGEGISSRYFAKLLSQYIDELITIDPHLHRWHSLNDIFSIPTTVLHATTPIAEWIKKQVRHPALIGPDEESEQWVSSIAKIAQCPFLIVEKTRLNDTTISSTIPKIEKFKDHTIILIDDIISTGVTMMETIRHIQYFGIKSIMCIGVHGIFANHADETLLNMGIEKLVTCNTIPHKTNAIDIANLIKFCR